MVVLHKACSTVPGTQSALAVLVVNTPLFQMKTLCDAQGRTLEAKGNSSCHLLWTKKLGHIIHQGPVLFPQDDKLQA